MSKALFLCRGPNGIDRTCAAALAKALVLDASDTASTQANDGLVEFKRAAVALMASGMKVSALARELGVCRQRLYEWRVAMQAGDELQSLDVLRAVQADPAAPFRRRQQPHRVVLADRANRQLNPPGEVIDGQRFVRLRRGSHGLDNTIKHCYGKYRDC